MTRVIYTGFEPGEPLPGGIGTPDNPADVSEIVMSPIISGTYCLHLKKTDLTIRSGPRVGFAISGAPYKVTSIRFKFMLAILPPEGEGVNLPIIELYRSGVNYHVSLRVCIHTFQGKAAIGVEFSGLGIYSAKIPVAVDVNTVHIIEADYFQDVGGGCRVYLDDNLIIEYMGVDTSLFDVIDAGFGVRYTYGYWLPELWLDDVELGNASFIATIKLTYQSIPIPVPATINGQSVASGSFIEVPVNSSVEINVPQEVEM